MSFQDVNLLIMLGFPDVGGDKSYLGGPVTSITCWNYTFLQTHSITYHANHINSKIISNIKNKLSLMSGGVEGTSVALQLRQDSVCSMSAIQISSKAKLHFSIFLIFVSCRFLYYLR